MDAKALYIRIEVDGEMRSETMIPFEATDMLSSLPLGLGATATNLIRHCIQDRTKRVIFDRARGKKRIKAWLK